MTGRRLSCSLGALLLALAALAGCAPAGPVTAEGQAPAVARRIVSLDYCADQYLLKLAPRDRILAVSPDADRDFSYMRDAARGLRQVAPRAEDVLVLKPDLVIRSYGGGPEAAAFYRRAGVPVLQLGYSGTLADVRAEVVRVARQLGVPGSGQTLAAQMDRRLAALRAKADAGQEGAREALYMTPGGVTTGPGSLIAEMLAAAGLRNFQREPGWHPLPLERLAYERPDIVAAAFFGSVAGNPDGWSAARHPVARAQLSPERVVRLDGAWTACGGWFVLDAIEALARGPGR